MKKKRIILRVENEFTQEKGYLSYLDRDREGDLTYLMNDFPEKAITYPYGELKREGSRLSKHLDYLVDYFPELIVEIEVLVTETMPLSIFEKYKAQHF